MHFPSRSLLLHSRRTERLSVPSSAETRRPYSRLPISRDIDTQKLATWNAFASEHPNVAKQLAYKPALINDDAYAKKHPALGAFFSQHPEIREAMAANPGNYVAIPPRPGE